MPTTAWSATRAATSRPALAGAAKKVEAVYAYPYQHHVTMEPQNATALYTADKCEVWCSTQNGEAALATASEASGLPVPKCEVYKTFLGGGFGRRATSQDYVRQAVLIAKEMPGTPIKMLWTREEDMTHGWYHPITQCKITAGPRQGQQLDRDPLPDLGPVDSRRRDAGAPAGGQAIRRRSPASMPAARKRPTAIRCRTSWSIIRCATRICIRGSGAV